MKRNTVRRILIVALALFTMAAFSMPQSASAKVKKPQRVTAIQVSATYQSATLTWHPSMYAQSYIIYRAGKKNGKYREIRTVRKTVYTEKHMKTGQSYWYRIRAVNGVKMSKLSPKVKATAVLQAPVLGVVSKSEGIYMNVTGRTPGANGYVYYRDGKKLKKKSKKKGRYYLDGKVAVGQAHKYTIRAYRKVGKKTVLSPPSQTVVAIRYTGAWHIAQKARQLAWPYGTSSKKYKYPSGSATEAFQAAIEAAYPNRSKWAKQTRAGASCDVFVGTVVRASGYDPTFPRGLDEVEKYMKKHKNLWIDTGITSEDQMKVGDILYQLYKGGGGHIVVYLGNGLVANAHHGGKTFGVIQKMHSGGGISYSWKTFKVYRAIR